MGYTRKRKGKIWGEFLPVCGYTKQKTLYLVLCIFIFPVVKPNGIQRLAYDMRKAFGNPKKYLAGVTCLHSLKYSFLSTLVTRDTNLNQFIWYYNNNWLNERICITIPLYVRACVCTRRYMRVWLSAYLF